MPRKAATQTTRAQHHRAPSPRRALRQAAREVADLIAKPRRLLDQPRRLHRLRVRTRRAQAAIQVAGPALRKKDAKWLDHHLRNLRRAAGRVRDLDLARAHFTTLFNPQRKSAKHDNSNKTKHNKNHKPAKKILARLDRDRRKAARALRNHIKRHDDATLNHHLNRALNHLRTPTSPDELNHHAATAVTRASRRLAQALATDPRRAENLHRTRRRLKALRYILELAAPNNPATAHQLKPLARLQQRLGDANDLHRALTLFDNLAHRTNTTTALATTRQKLARHEARARQTAITALAAWPGLTSAPLYTARTWHAARNGSSSALRATPAISVTAAPRR